MAKPGLPRQPGHEAVGIREPPHAQHFQARKGAELSHPAGRQVGGGVPLDRDELDAVELPDIPQEFVVHVVAFNIDVDHRVEHIGAEGVAQPFRPSRLGVLVELAEGFSHPFRPSRLGVLVALAGHVLPIVVNAASRVPAERRDRRDGIALDVGAVERPSRGRPRSRGRRSSSRPGSGGAACGAIQPPSKACRSPSHGFRMGSA